MSTWSDLDLPLPEVSGYGYTHDSGVLRTSFVTAHPRQARTYQTNRRTFSAEVQVTQAQLKVATDFLEVYGFTWFSIELLSGQYFSEPVSTQCVRLSADYSVSAVGYDLYKLQMSLEQLVEVSTIYTSMLYPFNLEEAAALTLPEAPEDFELGMPINTLEQVAFIAPDAAEFLFDLDTVNWNELTKSPEEFGFTLPDVDTDFTLELDVSKENLLTTTPEAVELALPAKITGKLE
jgi:hypothetical protein